MVLAKKKKSKKPNLQYRNYNKSWYFLKKQVVGLAITFCLIPQLLSQASIGQKSYQFSADN